MNKTLIGACKRARIRAGYHHVYSFAEATGFGRTTLYEFERGHTCQSRVLISYLRLMTAEEIKSFVEYAWATDSPANYSATGWLYEEVMKIGTEVD